MMNPPGARSRISPWLIGAATVVVVLALVQWLFPPPFVVERPGPVVDTLGEVVDKEGAEPEPMISIRDAETYPTEGQLNLLTVSIHGSPDRSIGWLGLVPALFDPSQQIVPMAEIYPPGVSSEDRQQQNDQLMNRSQADATVAALRQLGEEVPATVSVSGIAQGSPAEGKLADGDVLVRVNGTEVVGYEQLRRLIADNGADEPAQITVLRGGEEVTVGATPVSSGTAETPGPAVLGIAVTSDYDFPVDVELRINDIGGPSAGMMFALGIMDTLTPGSLTGGHTVSGTGTIDGEGTVGAIGGLPQKMYGAAEADTDLFLMAIGNCDAVPVNIPGDMTVAPVATLAEAERAIEDFAAGKKPAGLERCDSATSQATPLS